MQKSTAMNAFAKNVLDLVQAEGITITQLAERCAIRRSYLSRIIHGHHSPSLQHVEDIALALNVEPHELITPGFSKNLQTVS